MLLFNAFPAWPFSFLWLMDKDVYKWIGFRNIDSEQIHLTQWKDLKKSRKNNKLTQITTLCLQSNFILHKSSPYLMRYFSGDIWKTNPNCLQCEQSLDASSVERSSLFFTCRLSVVTYQTLYLHTCKQLLHFLHAPRNSLSEWHRLAMKTTSTDLLQHNQEQS